MDNDKNSYEKALFAGGCFWCMESELQETPGVVEVISGYTGGVTENPTYKDVSSGTTGHFEAVEVIYDPAQIGYEKILDIYWNNIDPTDEGGQFYDRGSHYRTAIFYTNDQQKTLAESTKAAISAKLKTTIHTEILAAGPFYPAEDYHQDYYKKNPGHYKAYATGSGRKEKIKKLWEGVEER